MRRVTQIIIGFSAALGCSTVHAGEIARTARCIPVGIIVESQDQGISGGSEICKDSSISIDAGSRVRVLCKVNPNIKWLGAGAHNSNDVCPAYSKTHQCEPGLSCNRGGSGIAIKEPKSNTLLNGHHQIEWDRVQGANAYQVTIATSSGEIIESHKTDVPKIDSIGPLVEDEVYQVTIRATDEKGDEINQGSHVFITLAQTEIDEITSLEHFIQLQPLTTIEETIYLNAIYQSYGLLDQLINIDAMEPQTD